MNDQLSIWTPRRIIDMPLDLSRIQTLIESKRWPGAIEGVNLRKLYEFPFWLTTDSPNPSISVSANSSSPLTSMRVSAAGPAIVNALSVKRTGTALISLNILDGQTPQTLMNQPIHIDAIVGDNTLPYRLAEPIFTNEQRAIMVAFTDLSGSANAFRFVMHAARHTSVQYDPKLEEIQQRLKERQFISMPFWYTTDQGAVTLSASGSSTVGISIAQDHHFLLYKMSVVATSRLFNMQLIDTTKGKSLVDGPGQAGSEVSANLWLGDNTYPFVWPEPILFEAGTKIQVYLTDRSASQNVIYLALHGSIIKTAMGRR